MTKRGEAIQAEILALLRQDKAALSAYDILDALRKRHPKIAPPTVYRALAALGRQGRIHRLESRNAFMACQCDVHEQPAVLSVCEDCGIVTEDVVPDLWQNLIAMAHRAGFRPLWPVIELHGRCALCDAKGQQTVV